MGACIYTCTQWNSGPYVSLEAHRVFWSADTDVHLPAEGCCHIPTTFPSCHMTGFKVSPPPPRPQVAWQRLKRLNAFNHAAQPQMDAATPASSSFRSDEGGPSPPGEGAAGAS